MWFSSGDSGQAQEGCDEIQEIFLGVWVSARTSGPIGGRWRTHVGPSLISGMLFWGSPGSSEGLNLASPWGSPPFDSPQILLPYDHILSHCPLLFVLGVILTPARQWAGFCLSILLWGSFSFTCFFLRPRLCAHLKWSHCFNIKLQSPAEMHTLNIPGSRPVRIENRF